LVNGNKNECKEQTQDKTQLQRRTGEGWHALTNLQLVTMQFLWESAVAMGQIRKKTTHRTGCLWLDERASRTRCQAAVCQKTQFVGQEEMLQCNPDQSGSQPRWIRHCQTEQKEIESNDTTEKRSVDVPVHALL